MRWQHSGCQLQRLLCPASSLRPPPDKQGGCSPVLRARLCAAEQSVVRSLMWFGMVQQLHLLPSTPGTQSACQSSDARQAWKRLSAALLHPRLPCVSGGVQPTCEVSNSCDLQLGPSLLAPPALPDKPGRNCAALRVRLSAGMIAYTCFLSCMSEVVQSTCAVCSCHVHLAPACLPLWHHWTIMGGVELR